MSGRERQRSRVAYTARMSSPRGMQSLSQCQRISVLRPISLSKIQSVRGKSLINLKEGNQTCCLIRCVPGIRVGCESRREKRGESRGREDRDHQEDDGNDEEAEIWVPFPPQLEE